MSDPAISGMRPYMRIHEPLLLPIGRVELRRIQKLITDRRELSSTGDWGASGGQSLWKTGNGGLVDRGS